MQTGADRKTSLPTEQYRTILQNLTQVCFSLLFSRLHTRLKPEAAYGSLNDEEEEGGPVEIFSVVVLLVVSSLCPAPKPG